VKHRPTPPREKQFLEHHRVATGSSRPRFAALLRAQLSEDRCEGKETGFDATVAAPRAPYGIFLRCAVIAQAGQPSNGT